MTEEISFLKNYLEPIFISISKAGGFAALIGIYFIYRKEGIRAKNDVKYHKQKSIGDDINSVTKDLYSLLASARLNTEKEKYREDAEEIQLYIHANALNLEKEIIDIAENFSDYFLNLYNKPYEKSFEKEKSWLDEFKKIYRK